MDRVEVFANDVRSAILNAYKEGNITKISVYAYIDANDAPKIHITYDKFSAE